MPNKFRWSQQSLAIRAQLHPFLVLFCDEILTVHDIALITGWRSEEEQREKFDAGLSQVLESKHNTRNPRTRKPEALAVDFIPYVAHLGRITGAPPNAARDLKYFYRLAGVGLAISEALNLIGVTIRWGGDWDNDFNMDDQTFNDLYHWELVFHGASFGWRTDE